MKILFRVVSTILIGLIFLLICAYLLGYRVFRMEDNSSMYPTIKKGDILLVFTKIRCVDLKSGDIVIIRGDFFGINFPMTKRVIGTPGADIRFKNGSFYVNWKLLSEPYLSKHIPEKSEVSDRKWKVKEKELFVMGDNRDNSIDSRHAGFGMVRCSDVIGKLCLIF